MDDYIPEKLFLDQSRLTNVMVNLISNAIKFTNQGTVSVVANWLPDSQVSFMNFDGGDAEETD